uniref:Longipin n=1 Tax=Acutisoma longipes TaxID=863974 RepID=LNGP_ACULO|nr:RecName: Full=Longipin [Acutisoma longipes]
SGYLPGKEYVYKYKGKVF